MQSKNIIKSIYLENFLSYGSSGQKLDLQSLNVLIGSNASGKSNLIEAFRILNAVPEQVTMPIRDGGGVSEYLWKGGTTTPNAKIEAIVEWEQGLAPLQYELSFTEVRAGSLPQFLIAREAIDFVRTASTSDEPPFIYQLQGDERSKLYSSQKVQPQTSNEPDYVYSLIKGGARDSMRSILSLYKSPDAFPSFTHLEAIFFGIRFYTGWDLGRYGSVRLAQKADMPAKV